MLFTNRRNDKWKWKHVMQITRKRLRLIIRIELREHFLVEKLFEPGKVHLTYTHVDRMIFGGVTPTNEELTIKLDKELGVTYFLERRELGIINIGGDGSVVLDGEEIT